jgi:hypothetical protein
MVLMVLRATATLGLLLLPAAAQRPGPGGGGAAGGCVTGKEGAILSLACPAAGIITAVDFAYYGDTAGCGRSVGACGKNLTAEAAAACVGQTQCTVHCGHNDPEGCKQGATTRVNMFRLSLNCSTAQPLNTRFPIISSSRFPLK